MLGVTPPAERSSRYSRARVPGPSPTRVSKHVAVNARASGNGCLGEEGERGVGGVGEGAEIAVARDERNVGVEASLRDEGVAETRAVARGENFGTKRAGALPEAGLDRE